MNKETSSGGDRDSEEVGADGGAAVKKSSESGKGGLRVNQAFENVSSFLKGRNFPGTVRVSGSRRGSDPALGLSQNTRAPATPIVKLGPDSSSSASNAKHAAEAGQKVGESQVVAETTFPERDRRASEPAHSSPPSGETRPLAEVAPPSTSMKPCSAREKKFLTVLAEPCVNLKELGELVWSGCPVKQRPLCWKLLLGYIPPNTDRREEVLARKRQEYHNWVQQHFEIDDMERSEDELAILHQIGIDIPRTAAVVEVFHKPEIQRLLARILYIRAIRNPASSYVQGMNDLVTPFLAVFLSEIFTGEINQWDISSLTPWELCSVEADCYWCLCKVLDQIQDHYTFAQPGIQKICFKLSELVRRIDDEFHEHLKKEVRYKYKPRKCHSR
mmetsp:Transcript_24034/g.58927  ORF Transcript_24034/g.58927 Transcript_24034/m.58927 type:complete len:387 (-) Transcript_24034:1420-2580(-)